MEAKNFILNRAYIETTEKRLVDFYEKFGFEIYDYLVEEETGLQLWFGRMNFPEIASLVSCKGVHG